MSWIKKLFREENIPWLVLIFLTALVVAAGIYQHFWQLAHFGPYQGW